jgi:hypothetical protein
MEEYYKSTIVVYSKQDWDGLKLTDLIFEASDPASPSSICSSWIIEQVSEEHLLRDPNAGQEVIDYLQGSMIVMGEDYGYNPYTDEEYEFYEPDEQ